MSQVKRKTFSSKSQPKSYVKAQLPRYRQLGFQVTGEHRPPKAGEWYKSPTDGAIQAKTDHFALDRVILIKEDASNSYSS
jgi:hypothetical protein